MWAYEKVVKNMQLILPILSVYHLKCINEYRYDIIVLVYCVKLFNTMKNDDIGTKGEIYG